jgi:hypothetical protein
LRIGVFKHLVSYIFFTLLQIKLRALLTHLQQLRIGYWGVATGKSQPLQSYGMASPHAIDVSDESQQPAEASGLGRSWVQSMFSRDRSLRATSFNRASKFSATTISALLRTLILFFLNAMAGAVPFN